MIRESPSHIYHSALPLSPSSSWLRGCYEAEVAGEVRVLMGLPERWDTCSRTIHFEGPPKAFAHCGDTIAVGIGSDVVLLDAVTGIRKSVLSGHTGQISSLASSVDGTLLVSRGDEAVNLWDVQTGGLIKTFGSDTPIVPTSTSPRQWDIDGHQIGTFCGEARGADGFTHTLDGTRFVSCGANVATVRDSESGAVVQLDAPGGKALDRCCISPDGKFVACEADTIIYIWNITTSEPRLVGNLEHSDSITFIAFPSSLVSGSYDRSVKFWQTNSLPVGSLTTDNIARSHGSTTIESVNLFAEEGIIVTSDSSGEVKTWDLTTGELKSSFSTPAKGGSDTHMASGTLTIIWWMGEEKEYHIWDVYKGQLLRRFPSPFPRLRNLKVSKDGSKIFGLRLSHIQAVSTQTGEDAGSVKLGRGEGITLFVRGSTVGINSQYNRGWDFGGPEVCALGEFPNRPRYDLVDWPMGRKVTPCWIEDRVTKRQVFRLPERYTKYGTQVEWDGRYLLVLTRPAGEVTVMDFDPVCPQ